MFSIIIPVKELNDYIRETVPAIFRLDRSDWELLIVTNEPQETEWPNDSRVVMLSSGRVGPAEKRDLAASRAVGDFLVFLDDDSYPQSDLLSIAFKEFEEGQVALGGPAVTPPHNSFLQKVSGAVFSSKLTGGSPERYRPHGSRRLVDDWPSVNLMIRREIFLEIGGFDSPFWPGEDTFLCEKLLNAGHHVLYVPELIVWHHRRPGLRAHAKQVGAYGLHRGYFARHLPANSRKFKYFLPSMVFLMLATMPLALLLGGVLSKMFFIGAITYGLGLLFGVLDAARHSTLAIALAAVPYIVITHFSYGYWFIRGFTMTKPLVSKLR